MSKLKEMVLALINEDEEKAKEALHQHIVEAAKMSFNKKTGYIMGPVKDWLSAINGTSDDVAKAFAKAKELDSYKELSSLIRFKSSAKQAENGTFTFDLPDGAVAPHMKDATYYNVSPFGQIRAKHSTGAVGGSSHTRMRSEKPTVVVGKPVETILKNYDKGFKELLKKVKTKMSKMED